MRGLSSVCRFLATWRVLALATVPVVVMGVSPGIASASSAPHRPLLHRVHAGPGSGLTLAQAPAGLRSAVRRTLGGPAVSAGSAFKRAKLTASDRAANDNFGWSVALSGSTAVVGAFSKNSRAGAAYVFVHSGSTWTQQAKLTASDGAAGDEFGFSVAISGSTAVAGAIGKNSNAGAAYVFTRSGTTWSQQAELSASDSATGGFFGYSVALSGSTAVVGAIANDSGHGAAYVFTRTGKAWSQQAELTAFDGAAGDEFGLSVALSGSTAVVGAPHNNGTGAMYVFTSSGSTWSLQAKLTAADGASGDEFGKSVALSGSTAVVGAPGKSVGTGAAYVLTNSGGTWSQQAELTASDGAVADNFGNSVALSGSTAVVSAPGNNSNTGAAYVFTFSSNIWSPQAKLTASRGKNDFFGNSVALSGTTAVAGAYGETSFTGAAYVFGLPSQQAAVTASDGAANDDFGISVALSGSTALVGASGKNSSTGAAYVFTRSGSTWSQQAELTASDGVSGDDFGFSVALSGSTAVVGASGNSNSSTGAAYVFTGSGSTWTQQAKLTASDGAANDDFGTSVALSGSTVVVGAPGNNGRGAAYVFTGSGSTWTQQAKLTASDGAPGYEFGVSVALSGSTALVGSYGKKSFTGAAYVFTNSGSTWTQQAELTASDGAANDDFGFSVALSGSTAVVGAFGNNRSIGAAYVFLRSGSTWTQQAKLTGSSGGGFGSSVVLSGSTALVGAPLNPSHIGAAYVFVNV